MSLPRTGNPEELLEARFGAAEGASGVPSPVMVPAGDGGPVVIPDAALLRDGAFLREGGDLVIRGADGAEVVVQGYFAAAVRPTLTVADGGVALSPGLVDSFLSAMAPGQYAQMAGSAQSPIGQVDELKGEAFAVRADGTRVQLATGDPVFEGDIVETGGGTSAIRMVFVDKTMFALGSEARLALDELVFDPSQSSGSSQFSILKGVFIFSSGQIAKTDNTEMTVVTPVAAIGIRGTEVAGRVDGANSQFTLIDGAIEVTTQAGSVTLDAAGGTTLVTGIDAAPSEAFGLSAAEYGVAYGGITGVAPNFFTTGSKAAGEGGDLSSSNSDDLGNSSGKEVSETVEHELASTVTFEGASGDDGTSPFRTETVDPDVFSNPYVSTEPYGTIEISADSDGTDASPGGPAGSTLGDIAEDGGYAEEMAGQGGVDEPASDGAAVPAAEIVLTLSNETLDKTVQDLTNSFVLPDLGPGSETTVFGSEMGLPGVAADAWVDVARDGGGNAKVALGSAWNSIKNILAESDQAADISISNFVHADLAFGDGGDSNIAVDAVKRGFIETGDGNDRVEISAFSNGSDWSMRVDVDTGAGDDTVIYHGSADGLSALTFRGGQGADTLQLTGSGQTFDLSTAQYDLTGIERIDLSAAPDATLTLDANIVSKLTDSGANAFTGTPDTLVVSGTIGDEIDLMNEAAWAETGTGDIDGESYTLYKHAIDGVRIALDDDVVIV